MMADLILHYLACSVCLHSGARSAIRVQLNITSLLTEMVVKDEL